VSRRGASTFVGVLLAVVVWIAAFKIGSQ